MSAAGATVVLTDDHQIMRQGVRLILEHAGHTIVAEAGTAEDAARRLLGHRPDVLVLDLNMPGLPSLALVPTMRRSSPGTAIVVLTMQDDVAYAREALRAGVDAYVLKESAGDELLQAIDRVRAGQSYLSPALGARLAAAPETERGHPDGLTEREVAVLGLLAGGYTSAQIAERLFLSPRTIDTHRARLLAKTRSASRADLVTYAYRHGLTGAVEAAADA